LQDIQARLSAGAGKLTPQVESDLQVQGQRKQRDLQRMQEDLQGDVERDRQEILARAGQRMQEVIKKLAEEKGLDVVIDTSNTIFFKPALEISADATLAYDKAHPAK
jgi:outer membrane protein